MAVHVSATKIRCRIIRAVTGFIGNLIGNVTGDIAGSVTPNSYTVAQLEDGTTLPADENTNKIVVCSNGDGGSPCLAISNGTSWLRIALGTAVAE
jgi:hypothetical protein